MKSPSLTAFDQNQSESKYGKQQQESKEGCRSVDAKPQKCTRANEEIADPIEEEEVAE